RLTRRRRPGNFPGRLCLLILTLQSVLRVSLVPALTVFCLACARQPWYPPPAQRSSMNEASPDALGPLVAMSDPNAGAYVVQGFRGQSEGPWRWALDHPVLRFYLPQVGRINFTMDVTFPETNLRQTGPVTIALSMNGTPFDCVRFDQPGGHQYLHA